MCAHFCSLWTPPSFPPPTAASVVACPHHSTTPLSHLHLPVERLLVAPEDLISSGDFVPLRHSVRTAVLAKLGDLEVTLNHPGMTAMLQRLPLASLTGLLSSDRLRVASECSVVAAINAWIRGCGGKDHVSQEVGGRVRAWFGIGSPLQVNQQLP